MCFPLNPQENCFYSLSWSSARTIVSRKPARRVRGPRVPLRPRCRPARAWRGNTGGRPQGHLPTALAAAAASWASPDFDGPAGPAAPHPGRPVRYGRASAVGARSSSGDLSCRAALGCWGTRPGRSRALEAGASKRSLAAAPGPGNLGRRAAYPAGGGRGCRRGGAEASCQRQTTHGRRERRPGFQRRRVRLPLASSARPSPGAGSRWGPRSGGTLKHRRARAGIRSRAGPPPGPVVGWHCRAARVSVEDACVIDSDSAHSSVGPADVQRQTAEDVNAHFHCGPTGPRNRGALAEDAAVDLVFRQQRELRGRDQGGNGPAWARVPAPTLARSHPGIRTNVSWPSMGRERPRLT